MIITAIERKGRVYVYDENKNVMYNEEGTLHGYTSSACSIKRGKNIYTYNIDGKLIFSESCD